MTGSAWNRHLIAAGLLVALNVFVYAQVRSFDFVNFDDDVYLVDNARVSEGLTSENLRWAFTTFHHANWHPTTWLSYFLDVEFAGFNPSMFHLTNVILHLLNSLLLYAFLFSLSAASWRSLAVAALFAVHPLHVESVAWISERKDLLCAFFWLTASIAYVGYARKPSLARYAPIILFHALALMSKPMAVTFPFVLLLLDHWPLKRLSARTDVAKVLAEKTPLIVLSMAGAVIAMMSQAAAGAVRSGDTLTIGLRIANAFVSYVSYLANTLWPTGLAFFYPYPAGGLDAAQVVFAIVCFLAITAAAIRHARTAPYILVGWLWFVGTLVPVIGLVQVGSHAMADRYMYIPMTGFLIALVWGVSDWASESRVKTRSAAIVCGGVVVALSILARAQTETWRDSETLTRHALRVTENNFLAHNNLGLALRDSDQDEAIRQFKTSLEISPEYTDAHLNLGGVYLERKSPDKAIAVYLDAIGVQPDNAHALFGMGRALSMKGAFAEAVIAYEGALRIDPERAATHSNLANALAQSGRLDEARPHYDEALRIEPGNPVTHLNLANCLLLQGLEEECISHLEEALRLRPELAPAREMLDSLRKTSSQ